MNKFIEFIEFIKNSIQAVYQFFDTAPSNDLDSFIKFKNPQSKEELDLAMQQYDEMRRMESRLISRGQYGAALSVRKMYWN